MVAIALPQHDSAHGWLPSSVGFRHTYVSAVPDWDRRPPIGGYDSARLELLSGRLEVAEGLPQVIAVPDWDGSQWWPVFSLSVVRPSPRRLHVVGIEQAHVIGS